MTHIYTSIGFVDENRLQYHEEVTDNDNEHTVAQVWRLDGLTVKRSVHVHLKQGLVTQGTIGSFG